MTGPANLNRDLALTRALNALAGIVGLLRSPLGHPAALDKIEAELAAAIEAMGGGGEAEPGGVAREGQIAPLPVAEDVAETR